MQVLGKCGEILYFPEPIEKAKSLVNWNITQINPGVVPPGDQGQLYSVYFEKPIEYGDYDFKVCMNSTYSPTYPTSCFTLLVSILPCFVENVSTKNGP